MVPALSCFVSVAVSNTRFIAAVIERHAHSPERRRRYWGRSGTESDHGECWAQPSGNGGLFSFRSPGPCSLWEWGLIFLQGSWASTFWGLGNSFSFRSESWASSLWGLGARFPSGVLGLIPLGIGEFILIQE